MIKCHYIICLLHKLSRTEFQRIGVATENDQDPMGVLKIGNENKTII